MNGLGDRTGGPHDGAVGTLTVVEQDDVTVVRLAGEIDAALRADASTAMARMFDRGRPVVLETSGVTFIDSIGIAFLIQCSRSGREDGLPVVLDDPAPVVSQLLVLVGADRFFRTPLQAASWVGQG